MEPAEEPLPLQNHADLPSEDGKEVLEPSEKRARSTEDLSRIPRGRQRLRGFPAIARDEAPSKLD